MTTTKNRTRNLILAMLLPAGFAFCCLPGCEDEGPAEEAGENIDDAVEETGDEIDDATDGG